MEWFIDLFSETFFSALANFFTDLFSGWITGFFGMFG